MMSSMSMKLTARRSRIDLQLRMTSSPVAVVAAVVAALFAALLVLLSLSLFFALLLGLLMFISGN